MLLLKGEIEKNNNFYKKTKKKIRNQNNEDQIEKHNTINLNWMMKLKTNKKLTKGQWWKIKNSKSKDQIR
jgi:predicted lysophospholipase L1 biosynthesis ABC-type transport system permease subunit